MAKSPFLSGTKAPEILKQKGPQNTLTANEQARLRGMLNDRSPPELASLIGIAETTLMRALAYPPLPLHGATASKIRQKLPV